MIKNTSEQDQVITRTAGFSNKKILGAGLLLSLFLGLGLSQNWVNAYSLSSAAVEKSRLSVSEILRGDFTRDVSVQGRVVASIRPTLFSPAQGSVELKVRSGDKVTLDQVLAVISSPELESQLKQETVSLQSLELEVSRQNINNKLHTLEYQQKVDLIEVRKLAAQRELRRAKLSIKSQLISALDFEKFKDDLSTVEMEYLHAKAEAALQIEKMDFELQVRMIDLEKQNIKVREFQRQLDQLEITSPVNGMVGDLLVDQQSAVTKNQELMLVVDLSALEVEVDIPESYADDLDFGMKAQVSYNRETFTGTLTAISPEVNNSRVTGTIRFDEEVPQGLRQNQQLSTRIIIESRENVLKVKRGAFVQSGSGRYTYKVEGDLASRQTIKIGASSINEVEIVSGLREGDFIVTSDLSILGNAENVLLTQ